MAVAATTTTPADDRPPTDHVAVATSPLVVRVACAGVRRANGLYVCTEPPPPPPPPPPPSSSPSALSAAAGAPLPRSCATFARVAIGDASSSAAGDAHGDGGGDVAALGSTTTTSEKATEDDEEEKEEQQRFALQASYSRVNGTLREVG